MDTPQLKSYKVHMATNKIVAFSAFATKLVKYVNAIFHHQASFGFQRTK